MKREFERIFRDMPIGAVVLTEDYRIEFVNEAFGEFIGCPLSELKGASIFDYVDPQDRKELMEKLRELRAGERKFVGTDTRYRRKDGTLKWGYPVWMLHPTPSRVIDRSDAMLVLVVDVTDRRRVEMQIRQSEQMDSLGMLAGSVAHEFNNVLTIIKAFVELLEADPRTLEVVNESVERIRAACERGESMTHQLLEFGRHEDEAVERVEMNEFIRGANDMFGWILPPTVQVELSLGESNPAAVTNRGRLQRLLINRVLEARDAMEGEGTLTLKTRLVSSEDVDFPTYEPIEAGDYALLQILDTGNNVPAANIPEVLEPFLVFDDEGGEAQTPLRAIHGVYAHEEGFICIESRRSGGTKFELYLPAV